VLLIVIEIENIIYFSLFFLARSISIRIIDDDVTVRDLIPDNLGNTLEDDLYKNEPVIAGVVA
jgi:hypothetical protein